MKLFLPDFSFSRLAICLMGWLLSFQGLGEDGLKMLKEASEITSLPLFSEIMDAQHLSMMEKYVDVLQIGARNMQNFKLLEAVGESKLPVLLKLSLIHI